MKFLIMMAVLGGVTQSIASDPRPTWFSQDYRSTSEWGFFCEGTGGSEEEALQSARSSCANKICMLFGVEVEAKTTTEEKLNSISVTNSVIESCPKVRVVGRVEKRKIVSCEDQECKAYVLHLYPKKEYDKEYKRLNQPAMVKVLEKQIIVRERNETFKDPAQCRTALRSYSEVRGETYEESRKRIQFLTTAEKDCTGLDYRNFDLQSELLGYLIRSTEYRALSAAMYLSRLLNENPSVVEKIESFLAFEQRQAKGGQVRERLRKLLMRNFDYLFYRDNYQPGSQAYVSVDGSKHKTNPYLDELKSCKRTAELVLAWPGDLGENVTACVPKINKKGQDCQTTNIIMIRSLYASCVCRVGAPNYGDCVRVVFQLINETCPAEMTTACYSKASQRIAERMALETANP